jgi:hypothetical protein
MTSRQTMSKRRIRSGRRVVLVEIADDVPDLLIEQGLLAREHEENWREVGAVLSHLIALWLADAQGDV